MIGERLCGNLRSLRAVRPIVRHHHELLDGSGYPDGLRGNDVPLLAQIVSITDTYDAITTTRPYRSALTAQHAHDELRSDAERGLRDRELVEAFIAVDCTGELAGVRGGSHRDGPADFARDPSPPDARSST